MMPPECIHCGEPLDPFGSSAIDGTHNECAFRMVIGSVAHCLRRCGCFVPGSDEHDPENMTKREAAQLAIDVYRNDGRLPPGRLTELYLISRPMRAGERVM